VPTIYDLAACHSCYQLPISVTSDGNYPFSVSQSGSTCRGILRYHRHSLPSLDCNPSSWWYYYYRSRNCLNCFVSCRPCRYQKTASCHSVPVVLWLGFWRCLKQAKFSPVLLVDGRLCRFRQCAFRSNCTMIQKHVAIVVAVAVAAAVLACGHYDEN